MLRRQLLGRAGALASALLTAGLVGETAQAASPDLPVINPDMLATLKVPVPPAPNYAPGNPHLSRQHWINDNIIPELRRRLSERLGGWPAVVAAAGRDPHSEGYLWRFHVTAPAPRGLFYGLWPIEISDFVFWSIWDRGESVFGSVLDRLVKEAKALYLYHVSGTFTDDLTGYLNLRYASNGEPQLRLYSIWRKDIHRIDYRLIWLFAGKTTPSPWTVSVSEEMLVDTIRYQAHLWDSLVESTALELVTERRRRLFFRQPGDGPRRCVLEFDYVD